MIHVAAGDDEHVVAIADHVVDCARQATCPLPVVPSEHERDDAHRLVSHLKEREQDLDAMLLGMRYRILDEKWLRALS
jgi:hypothetical protein